ASSTTSWKRTGAYRGDLPIQEDEFFYKGHFPENPITPRVILVEAMAQTGCRRLRPLPFHDGAEGAPPRGEKLTHPPSPSWKRWNSGGIVKPGEGVIIRGEDLFQERKP
ncbi:MAG: hypothetical protein IPI61_14915, partial [Syntrophaceae bacterium]|nr:hypothetical protein [Syntrophaceae bacterium]